MKTSSSLGQFQPPLTRIQLLTQFEIGQKNGSTGQTARSGFQNANILILFWAILSNSLFFILKILIFIFYYLKFKLYPQNPTLNLKFILVYLRVKTHLYFLIKFILVIFFIKCYYCDKNLKIAVLENLSFLLFIDHEIIVDINYIVIYLNFEFNILNKILNQNKKNIKLKIYQLKLKKESQMVEKILHIV